MKQAFEEALKRRKMNNQNGFPTEEGEESEKVEARKNDQAPEVSDAPNPDEADGQKVQIDLNVKPQKSSIMGDYNPSGKINSNEQGSMQDSLGAPDMSSFMNEAEEQEIMQMIARGDKPKSLLQRAQMERVMASKK